MSWAIGPVFRHRLLLQARTMGFSSDLNLWPERASSSLAHKSKRSLAPVFINLRQTGPESIRKAGLTRTRWCRVQTRAGNIRRRSRSRRVTEGNMPAIADVKELERVETPLFRFDCTLKSGDVSHWSTHNV